MLCSVFGSQLLLQGVPSTTLEGRPHGGMSGGNGAAGPDGGAEGGSIRDVEDVAKAESGV